MQNVRKKKKKKVIILVEQSKNFCCTKRSILVGIDFAENIALMLLGNDCRRFICL